MRIDLRRLYGLKKLEVNEDVNIPDDYYTKMGVRDIKNLHVDGLITINYENNIELNLNINGKFIMPCEVTGEDVECPFNTNIEEEIEENSLNDEFYLDLLDILWENIVLEIPFKVVKEGAELKDLRGEGWELTKED